MFNPTFIHGIFHARLGFAVLLLFFLVPQLRAHQQAALATYLGNEAILLESGGHKVLFDPFFHTNFGIYQLVPEEIKRAMLQGDGPYNNINAIVISHAHDDHFSAREVLSYLQAFEKTQLVAPQQAVDKVLALLKGEPNGERIRTQMHSLVLSVGDGPVTIDIAGMTFEGVRIPHAGWPGRADIQNIVFRVSLGNGTDNTSTVMHMGDADADDQHYLPHRQHWNKHLSDMVFPPYWFYNSAEGNDILNEIINARQSIGVHVPVVVPNSLKRSGHSYFSIPGEQHNITHQH